MRLCSSFHLALTTCLATVLLSATPALAQLELIPDTAPDRNLGTQVIQNGLPGSDVITGGTRSQNGQNLFHSFQEFNVDANRGVYFQNPVGVQNILTRVTGNNPSNIWGTLGVLGSANLFLLNPNGIFFGPNARLQINGSFVASTANSFIFPDGTEFSAVVPQAPPLLTVNITPGLQYGPIQPSGVISNQGNLQVGQDLSLVADVLSLQGQLEATRGDITLQGQSFVGLFDGPTTPFRAVAGRNLQVQGNQFMVISALSHPDSVLSAGGDLTLTSLRLGVGIGRFYAGGNFQLRNLDGSLGDLFSPVASIIEAGGNLALGNISNGSMQPQLKAGGDLTFGDYFGPSLKVESNGSIKTGNISITSRAFFGVPTTDPDYDTLSSRPAVILRAGVSTLNGTIGNSTNPPQSSSITVGDIALDPAFSPPSGAVTGPVILTAQANISTGRIVTTPTIFGDVGGIFLTSLEGGIDTTRGGLFTGARIGQAGDIVLNANKDIRTGNVYSSRQGISRGGSLTIHSRTGSINTTAGVLSSQSDLLQSGTITLLAGDRIDTGVVNTWSFFSSGGAMMATAPNGITVRGDLWAFSERNAGGNVTLISEQGPISVQSIRSYSYASNGGAIQLIAGKDINLKEELWSFSLADDNAKNGGSIILSARQGNITSSGISPLISASQAGITSGNGGDVTLTAQNQIRNLEIFTQSSQGQAGAIRIEGLEDLSINNTQVSTSTTINIKGPGKTSIGQAGRSGDVLITGTGDVTIDNSVLQGTTQSGDPAGNVTITSPGVVTFQNNSQIISNTQNTGKAGNILVEAGQGITLKDGSQVSATTTNSGSAGSITLNAPLLTIAGNAQIVAETQSSGRGGNITIHAPTAVNLTRVQETAPILSVEASGAGKAGDILINTPSLTLSDRARITATATRTATNPEGGGSITLNASNLNLSGIVGVFAETQGQAPAGTLTLNPYLSQPDLKIALTSNSQISASTAGRGKGGDLIATAPQSITVAGSGKLAVETSSTGNAGNMTFTTQQLTLTDGVELSASTTGAGKAGEIRINAETFKLDGGAKVLTNTFNSGQAGDITVNVTDRLLLTDPGTGLFASTTPGSTGNGGNIIIDPRFVQIGNGATIAVDSKGSGTGGSISLQAGRLELRDRGSITAETASAQGGNITLDVRDLLLLRRNSLISATAGTAQAAGDGGNITIRAPFIIGVLRENSDITANAFTGRGGNINITTNTIFGLLPQAQLTPLSDITASSEFGLSGTITITALNVDPNRGLVALPTNLTDASRQIREACTPNSAANARRNSFVVVGRGGLPVSPEATQTGDRPLVNLVSLIPSSANQTNVPSTPAALTNTEKMNEETDEIVEAQVWIQAKNGEIYLTADTGMASIHPQGLASPACALH